MREYHYQAFLRSAFAAAVMDYNQHKTDTSTCEAESDNTVSTVPTELTALKIVTYYITINSKGLHFQAQVTLSCARRSVGFWTRLLT